MTLLKHSITNIDDQKLKLLIGQTETRLFFMAPGVSDAVAESLVQVWRKLGTDNVTIVLDVDPDVCRLGYGTIEGLKLLRLTATEVSGVLSHQPGVRIGVLVSDASTIIFSPAPLLIEANSRIKNRPNAIELDELSIELAKDIGHGDNPDLHRTVGLDPVTPAQIDSVENNLAQAPPVRFDLARQVRVFTTLFQFVEFEMRGCYISRKKVSLPSYLVGLAGEKEVESRFHAQFDLVNKQSDDGAIKSKATVTETDLKDMKKDIVRDFLIQLPGFGSVIIRSRKEEFIRRSDELCKDVQEFQKFMRTSLQDQINKSVEQLVSALLPAVKKNVPIHYLKYSDSHPSEERVAEFIREDLKRAFGEANDHVSEMKVSIVFKDVAYESLADEKFVAIAKKAIPGIEKWYHEYDVVHAKDENDNE